MIKTKVFTVWSVHGHGNANDFEVGDSFQSKLSDRKLTMCIFKLFTSLINPNFSEFVKEDSRR